MLSFEVAQNDRIRPKEIEKLHTATAKQEELLGLPDVFRSWRGDMNHWLTGTVRSQAVHEARLLVVGVYICKCMYIHISLHV